MEGKATTIIIAITECVYIIIRRTTMFTEYTILQKMHGDVEDQLVLSVFKYNHFCYAWYSFISLLDIDYPEGFRCEICGNSPSTVIMDGTSLSFRRALDLWKSFIGPVPKHDLKQGR